MDGDSFDLTANVPDEQMRSHNGLRLRPTALLAGGDYSGLLLGKSPAADPPPNAELP